MRVGRGQDEFRRWGGDSRRGQEEVRRSSKGQQEIVEEFVVTSLN